MGIPDEGEFEENEDDIPFQYSHGITQVEAERLLIIYGRNELPEKKIPKWLVQRLSDPAPQQYHQSSKINLHVCLSTIGISSSSSCGSPCLSWSGWRLLWRRVSGTFPTWRSFFSSSSRTLPSDFMKSRRLVTRLLHSKHLCRWQEYYEKQFYLRAQWTLFIADLIWSTSMLDPHLKTTMHTRFQKSVCVHCHL